MLRTLLGVIVLLALPVLLNAQAPSKSNAGVAPTALTHGSATQVQGEVVTDEINGANGQEGIDEADGENNDGQNNDGQFEQQGEDEPDGMNNGAEDQTGQNDDAQQEGGQDDGSSPASAQGRIGRHKP